MGLLCESAYDTLPSQSVMIDYVGHQDEFNRLEERMLSAVSQQVQSIQLGLLAAVREPDTEIELVGRQLKINTDTGIFISA